MTGRAPIGPAATARLTRRIAAWPFAYSSTHPVVHPFARPSGTPAHVPIPPRPSPEQRSAHDPNRHPDSRQRKGGAGRYGERERAHGLHLAAILVTCGLRDYGLPPTVWGGQPGCAHDWGQELRRHQGGPHGPLASTQLSGGSRVIVEAQAKVKKVRAGQLCRRCAAWQGCLGLEPSPELYLDHLVQLFRDLRRVLRPDGTLWLVLGDCHAGAGSARLAGANRPGKRNALVPSGDLPDRQPSRLAQPGLKPKDLVGLPWQLALALRADGWWLRQAVIWSKRNPMPESAPDRPTTAHEYVFLLTRSSRYFYDAEAVREPDAGADHPRRVLHRPEPSGGLLPPHGGIRNAAGRQGAGRHLRSVWTLATSPLREPHFAAFPPQLADRCIRAGTSERGCCPRCGTPWTRILERRFEPQPDVSAARGRKGAPGQKPMDATNSWQGFPRGTTRSVTTGWRPTCECDPRPEPVPAVILDPFSGAGTTALAALSLGRDAVGIELNPDYVAMATRRIRKDAPLLNRVVVREDGSVDDIRWP
jgi:DNA modification methylase